MTSQLTQEPTGRRRFSPRRVISAAAAATVVLGLTVAVASPTAAAPGPVVSRSSTGVTADALPTVQVDGVVWTQAVHGNTVYAGGSFTTARPAGSAAGVNTVTRNNLLAYDITTGALITSFAPSLNAQVKALALSPDGTRLYVGGDFTSANGQDRYRIAAYDTASGALISSFAPGTDTTVNAIVATSTTVYVGGAFSNANGVARTRFAAFSATDGSLLGWAPTADNNSVEAMVLTPAGDKLIVGGSFTTLNQSTSGYGLGALDPTTGALVPWTAASVVQNAGTKSAVLSLTTDGNAIYGSAYDFGAGGNLEGAFSANPSSGAVNWVEDCHGDTYDTFPVNGVVYTVGHAHDCSNTGDFPQTDPWSYHHALSWTAGATGTNLTNQVSGYGNWGGTPSPSLVNWFPDFTDGTYTGQSQATWSVSGNSRYVVVGGEFPTVNGVAQQGLVRFAVPSAAPNKQGPMMSGSLYQTTESPVSATSARVSWSANTDRDDQTLTYQLIRDGDDNHPIYTTTATAPFWNLPTLSYVDTGLAAGSTHNYYVRVTDPDGNSVRGDYTTITLPTSSASPYAQQVLVDGASSYWRFDEAAGATTSADSAGSSPLTQQSGVTEGASGAIMGDSDTAATFSGTSNGSASTATPITAPNTFSVEAWFKTGTTSGGKIIGFGASQTGSSSSYDRQLYMDNSGRLYFGVYPGSVQTINTTTAYNDNAWHQVVGTLSSAGMKLYVDGALIGSNPTTSGQAYSGFWRVGGDNLGAWPSTPRSQYFAGTIDDTAVYPTALSLAAVQSHYTKSGRTVSGAAAPTAAFTSSCSTLTCSFDASTSAAAGGATISSYSWAYGDGASGTGATSSHAYTTAGTYQVTLTVTDSAGGTNSVTKNVTPAAPVAPTAAFTSTCTGLACTFDASGSTAAGGATVTGYQWAFGDGSTGSGVKPAHTYAAGGSDTVTVTVTDSNGKTGSVARTVTPVAPAAPTATFTTSCTNLACSVDASASSAANGATITSYAWTFGDNSSGTGAKTSHTYSGAGSYTVTLTVLDSNNTSASTTRTVTPTAAAAAPTASFTSSCTNLSCAFNGSASSAAAGATIKTYGWTFGDNTTGTGSAPSHTYAAAGTYTVTLSVTDSAGRVGSATRSVTVTAAASAVAAADAFGRTITGGWGTADTGGAWSVDDTSAFAVSGGVGRMTLSAPGAGQNAALPGVSAANLNLVFDVGMSKAATGNGLLVSLGVRHTASGEYRFKVRFMADGTVHLIVSKTTAAEGETVIREVAVSGLTYTAGQLLRARLQITGSGTTTITGKVWKVGSTEPAASQVTVTDNEAALQSAGSLTVLGYLAGNATNAPVDALLDNLTATRT